MQRGTFVVLGSATAAGLLLRATIAAQAQTATPTPMPTPKPVPIEALLHLRPDGTIVFQCPNAEMGQGTMTSLTQILADELDAPLEWFVIERADWDARLPFMVTEGSFGTVRYWRRMRLVGASARAMLRAAGAARWGVPIEECTTDRGVVVHTPSSRTLAYGALASEAAAQPVPLNPPLKDPTQYRYIGKPLARVDTPAKVHGAAIYGIDVRVPGMLYAALLHAPVFGTRLLACDPAPALRVRGVHSVVPLDDALAVVADSYWHAKKGLAALKPRFSTPAHPLDSATIRTSLERALASHGIAGKALTGEQFPVLNWTTRLKSGDARGKLATAKHRLERMYHFPYLAHATMEPMNCTVSFSGDAIEIWAPTQAQTAAHEAAVRITGLPPERVRLHTTFMGGGFGRRSKVDYVESAVRIGMVIKRPVKVVWSREEDMQHGAYRPASVVHMRAAIDERGTITAVDQRFATPSLNFAYDPKLPIDSTDPAFDGADDRPYAVATWHSEWVRRDFPIPVWFWRSVGHSFHEFAWETMVDEAARLAKRDPYRYRRALMGERAQRVLDTAATAAKWDTPHVGRSRGMAFSSLRGAVLAHVAEISLRGGELTIHRMTCAIDCGTVINPKIVESQVQGAVIWGLSAALRSEITIENGRVAQSNYDNYPVLRLHETPPIDVHIVASTLGPQGAGEVGAAGVAPALANAIAAASGRRIYELPLSKSGITLARG